MCPRYDTQSEGAPQQSTFSSFTPDTSTGIDPHGLQSAGSDDDDDHNNYASWADHSGTTTFISTRVAMSTTKDSYSLPTRHFNPLLLRTLLHLSRPSTASTGYTLSPVSSLARAPTSGLSHRASKHTSLPRSLVLSALTTLSGRSGSPWLVLKWLGTWTARA